MKGTYAAHYNPIFITTHIHGYIIHRLIADEGNILIVMFTKFWGCVKLSIKLILEVIGDVPEFVGHKSKPKGQITLNISLLGKH